MQRQTILDHSTDSTHVEANAFLDSKGSWHVVFTSPRSNATLHTLASPLRWEVHGAESHLILINAVSSNDKVHENGAYASSEAWARINASWIFGPMPHMRTF